MTIGYSSQSHGPDLLLQGLQPFLRRATRFGEFYRFQVDLRHLPGILPGLAAGVHSYPIQSDPEELRHEIQKAGLRGVEDVRSSLVILAYGEDALEVLQAPEVSWVGFSSGKIQKAVLRHHYLQVALHHQLQIRGAINLASSRDSAGELISR